MAANKEEEIDLIIRVVDKAINIHVTRRRSTDVVRDLQANAHLRRLLGSPASVVVRSSDIIGFEPAVDSNTRFCDFTAEDKEITAYVLANLDTPSLMDQVRTLLAEKENVQPEAMKVGSSKQPLHLPVHHVPSPLPSLTPQPNDTTVLNMMRDLELRLQQERKKDKEETQAQIKKIQEEAQAQRKKDKEEAQAQMKKIQEDARAQRKKDQEGAAEETRKFKLTIKELENQIHRLELRAIDREAEGKLKDEATKRYIESLADDIEATTDFLAVGDEAGLDRIKRRNLLDRAQASLALSLGLVNDRGYPSICFREALGPSLSAEERQARLSELLNEKKDVIPPEATLLLTKPAALNLLAEVYSKVRLDGDQVAHGYRQRSWYEGSVTRSVGEDKVALTNLLDFVLPGGQ